MEGKFASEGLQAIDGDDDMLTAMARELVENKGIGESADSVWRALGQLRPSTSAVAEGEPDAPIEQEDLETTTTLPLSTESIPGPSLSETARLPNSYSHKTSESGQLSLF
jgi:hypothetical protein